MTNSSRFTRLKRPLTAFSIEHYAGACSPRACSCQDTPLPGILPCTAECRQMLFRVQPNADIYAHLGPLMTHVQGQLPRRTPRCSLVHGTTRPECTANYQRCHLAALNLP